jgi:exodeoxyribonuclease VII large subunit
MASTARAAFSVAALLREVGDCLAARLSVCTVRGEISGFSRAASGHCYFNLKDADGGSALIRCAMFRRAASLLAFAPADGQQVEVRARLGVYEPRGELQLVVEAMQGAGAGALYEQFLRLRARLEAQGWFDAARKRALPAFPRAVGVVTSLGAAALHDVLTALARRAPQVRVVVYPTLVQGPAAPAAIAAALAAASARNEVDTLIVCRGGGSLEDLWAFNDERVVQAIVASALPVVCGVGHETDVTLADLAADVRAPTPTAAAELVAPTRESCLAALDAAGARAARRVHAALDVQAQRLDRIALRLARPGQVLQRQKGALLLLGHRLARQLPREAESRRERLMRLEVSLRRAVAMQFARRERIEKLESGLRRALGQQLATHAQRIEHRDARLRALDPSQVLARGYAWLSNAQGHAVTSVRQLEVGESVQAVLHDGSADVKVERVPSRPA